MTVNGSAAHTHAALAPGHFLFTSESVGEGHPGMSNSPYGATLEEVDT